MRIAGKTWVVMGALLCACKPITPDKVNTLQTCISTHEDVKELFGSMKEVGRSASLITWTYGGRARPELIVAFDDSSVVVDYAFRPPGTIELTNRCASRPASQARRAPATNATSSPSSPTTTEEPKGAAGFMFGASLQETQKLCEGANQAWSGADPDFVCSGPVTPTATGGPVAVRLCNAKLCRIVVQSRPTAEAWVSTQAALQKTLEAKYGAPGARDSNVPSECKQSLPACLADGRASFTSRWAFASGANISFFSGKKGTDALIEIAYERKPKSGSVATEGL
jgi:hypothetical protein